MDLEVDHAAAAAATVSHVIASSTTRISPEGDRDGERESEQNVKINCGLLVESSENSSSLRVGKRKASDEVEVVMHEDTLEAAVIDLEELVNNVKCMQRLLHNDAATSSWKLV